MGRCSWLQEEPQWFLTLYGARAWKSHPRLNHLLCPFRLWGFHFITSCGWGFPSQLVALLQSTSKITQFLTYTHCGCGKRISLPNHTVGMQAVSLAVVSPHLSCHCLLVSQLSVSGSKFPAGSVAQKILPRMISSHHLVEDVVILTTSTMQDRKEILNAPPHLQEEYGKCSTDAISSKMTASLSSLCMVQGKWRNEGWCKGWCIQLC